MWNFFAQWRNNSVTVQQVNANRMDVLTQKNVIKAPDT